MVTVALTYKGPLPSGNDRSKANAAKNHIRRELHPQLAAFCSTTVSFKSLLTSSLAQATRTPPEGPESFTTSLGVVAPGLDYFVNVGGVEFVPIVRKALHLGVRLEVHILHRRSIGRVFRAGDPDGRVKTLIDGLRMPHQSGEIHGFALTKPPQRYVVLLEDDALLSEGYDLRPYEWHEPAPPDADTNDVDVRIYATLSGTLI